MQQEKPVTVICTYRIKPGKETEMERLLAAHWPSLHRLGLVTEEKARIFRGRPSGKPGEAHGAERTYVEIFSWKSEEAPGLAHQMPEVLAVWEPMGAICEEMDFPHFDVISTPAV